MEKYDTYPLIFAEPRSGSTSITKICDIQQSVKFFNEPFNSVDKDWARRVEKNEESLFFYLKNFDICDDGLKHCPVTWSDEYNYRILYNASKVLFLRRKNKIEQLISWQVADRSGHFHKFMNGERENFDDSELNLEQLKEKCDHLNNFGRYIKNAENFFSDSLVITYEQLFKSDNVNQEIKKIYSFFNLDWNELNVERLNYWLSDDHQVLNDEKRNSIDNIDDTIKELKKYLSN